MLIWMIIPPVLTWMIIPPKATIIKAYIYIFIIKLYWFIGGNIEWQVFSFCNFAVRVWQIMSAPKK